MKLYHLSAKKVGFTLILISLILFILFFYSTRELMKVTNLECGEICGLDMEDGTCPHAKTIPLQSYFGFTITLILLGVGIFMILSGGKYKEELIEKERKFETVVTSLEGDEKKICELIKESGGAVFQSDLIEKTGLSKVKISRVLDKLEGRGLIERRRRGMTNLVILK